MATRQRLRVGGCHVGKRRNAIVLFSKVPAPGKVKTRLTPLKDGTLSPDWASYLYNCMFFDVAECCCDACAVLEGVEYEEPGVCDDYSLIISSPGIDQELAMRQLFANSGEWPCELVFIHDDGASFDEHYNDAFRQVWEMGYDTILSMGCDMPALTRDVIYAGFRRLHQLCGVEGGGIVLSPDQEMGVSIVGWTRTTNFDHTGVFYNRDGLTVLPAYIQKAQRQQLPVYYLPAIPDVDTMADLRHNVTLVQAISYCAAFDHDLTVPWRTLDAFERLGYTDIRVMPNELRDPREDIDS